MSKERGQGFSVAEQLQKGLEQPRVFFKVQYNTCAVLNWKRAAFITKLCRIEVFNLSNYIFGTCKEESFQLFSTQMFPCQWFTIMNDTLYYLSLKFQYNSFLLLF